MEEKKIVQAFYGQGKGKTLAAVGHCICAASLGQDVIMIQFLKGKEEEEFGILRNLEPQIKIFRFEKESQRYEDLPPDRQQEEKYNILNGFHFARKVAETSECDVLVLDEVLGLIDLGIISVQSVIALTESMDDGCSLVMTGQRMPEELAEHVDILSEIRPVKDLRRSM